MTDSELFAIEAWMRRQGLTGESEADREEIARRILWRMRLEQARRANRRYFDAPLTIGGPGWDE